MVRPLAWFVMVATLLVSWALPLHGAERVLSGDHDGFTRLVFAASGELDWQVEDLEAGKRISFDPELPALDVSNVFRRIGRNRLRGLRQAGGNLALDLACACELELFRIASGHVVIDIRDADGETRSNPTLPLVLPPIDLPPRLELDVPASPERSGADVPTSAQIRRHDGALPRSLLQKAVASGSEDDCSFETFARPLLLSDPVEAFERLRTVRGALVDASGDVDAKAMTTLSRLYLEMGWGPEALFAARPANAADTEVLQLAAAFGASEAGPRTEGPDPACGPASSLVAILMDRPSETLRRADPDDLARLMLDLPAVKRAAILPDVRRTLVQANLARHLSLLPSPESKSRPSERAQRAGTDAAAARAIIDDLARAGTSLDRAQVTNAQALRQSVPPGPDRDALDMAITTALMRAGYVAEAARAMNPDLVSPERLLDVAVKHLPIGQVAEAAMRLAGSVDPASPPARAALAALEAHGLSGAAARLRGRPLIQPRPAPPMLRPRPDGIPRIPPAKRQAVLDASGERLKSDGPEADDFRNAAQVLQWSGRMREALQDLVRPTETDR